MQAQDDMRTAEKAQWTTRKSDETIEEMWNVIGDSLSDLASSEE